ncbi:MAG: hypothetical protein ACRCYV_05030 [Aeromonas sp.]
MPVLRPLLWFCLSAGLALDASAATCRYRPEILDRVRYQCDDGRSGTLSADALESTRDSGDGSTWRQDALGAWSRSDGRRVRANALGEYRTQRSDGRDITWRKDVLGDWRASDGSVCRKEVLGVVRCRGEQLPPPLLNK